MSHLKSRVREAPVSRQTAYLILGFTLLAFSAACGPKKAEWVASPEDEQAILRGEPPKHAKKPGDEAYMLSDFGHSTALEITPDEISVDGKKVVDLSMGRIDASDMRDGAEGFLVGELLDVLSAAREHLDVQKVTVLEKDEEQIKLHAEVDYRVPFRTLASVLYTAGQAEYNLYRVYIVQTGESMLKGDYVDIIAPKAGGVSSIEVGMGVEGKEEGEEKAAAAEEPVEEEPVEEAPVEEAQDGKDKPDQEKVYGSLKGTKEQIGVLKTMEMIGGAGNLSDVGNLSKALNSIDWEAEPVVATAETGTSKAIYSSKSLNLSVFMTKKGFYISAHIPGFKTKHIPRISTGGGYDYNYEALYAAIVKIKVDHQKAKTIYVGTDNDLNVEYLAYLLNSVLWYKKNRMFKYVILTMSAK